MAECEGGGWIYDCRFACQTHHGRQVTLRARPAPRDMDEDSKDSIT